MHKDLQLYLERTNWFPGFIVNFSLGYTHPMSENYFLMMLRFIDSKAQVGG